jgi:glutamate synthase domain-containing protein 2/Fe-S-cluster-containing hydrogenase component 2
MSTKYHVETNKALPRFSPIARLTSMEIEGCLGCQQCVKRDSCVYGVYEKRSYDPNQLVDTGDCMCVACMRCVQECKKGIISRAINPQFRRMGDSHWQPDIIASLWKQAETGDIPVSGAGYRGPFAGPGFNAMWTDMSEIVRPTRDGIHGREYISTVIELGRRPAILEFDASGNLLNEMPRFLEIPIPAILEIPENRFVTDAVKRAIAEGAHKAHTYAVCDFGDASGVLADWREHLIVRFNPATDDPAGLGNSRLAELAFSDTVAEDAKRLREQHPGIITSIRIPLDEHAVKRAVYLTEAGAEILHFQGHRRAIGLGKRRKDFVTTLIKEIHFALLNRSVRDRVTLLLSGGMAAAEFIPKAIACGADGVGLDLALLVAMECRLCSDCDDVPACPVTLDRIPVDWAAQRIANLIGAWHSQLIEVMGAMGLREVRRLRGELGRTMSFDDLEKDNFSPIFGERTVSLEDALGDEAESRLNRNCPPPAKNARFHLLKGKIEDCPSRYRNSLGRFLVVRTADCINCGKCTEVCRYGVHPDFTKKKLAPKSHFCIGVGKCRAEGDCCIDNCPVNAIRIGPNPLWESFGDPRWPADMLAATWIQAETGRPPENGLEYKVGASGGGLDRIEIKFPDEPPDKSFTPDDVDLRIPLNRRNDNAHKISIGMPIYGGGMSFGSISLSTMVGRAIAFKAIDSFTCTGEGGYPRELTPYDDHVITQVATGLFGVREETIQRVRVVEFKYAQGAKPGLGGHLLGEKNTPAVSEMRETVAGYPLFSPFPFHSVYSVEDHKKHVDWMKAINPKVLVSVKVSGAADVDMVAVGSFYADAHIVHLDGSYGGTGAAPDIAKKNIAMPIEYAVPKVHRFLVEEGARGKITLIASGGIRSAWDVAKIIALGADGVVTGTADIVAVECIRCGVCESGRGCPRGIATTDPELSVTYSAEWAGRRLTNLFHSWAIQLQDICYRLGLKSIRDLVGRSDLLTHLDYQTEGLIESDKARTEEKRCTPTSIAS